MEVLIPIIAVLSIFVVLPWMCFHFAAKKRQEQATLTGNPGMNTDLQRIADKLDKRVQSLETILDAEVPGWRKHLEQKE